MRKVWISINLVFTILFIVSTISGAQSLSSIELPPSIEENIQVHAVLENLATGEKIYLAPHLVSFQEATNSEEPIAITYDIGIPGHLLGSSLSPNELSFLFPNVAHATEQKFKCDPTSSVCATLTFYYQEGMQNTYEWMYSQKVRSTWVRSDPQVSWSNAKIKAECQAEFFDRPQWCGQTSTGTVSNPISGAAYEIVPVFAGANNKTHVNDAMFQKASQEITLHRGGSNWLFTFCIANGGGTPLYGCY